MAQVRGCGQVRWCGGPGEGVWPGEGVVARPNVLHEIAEIGKLSLLKFFCRN